MFDFELSAVQESALRFSGLKNSLGDQPLTRRDAFIECSRCHRHDYLDLTMPCENCDAPLCSDCLTESEVCAKCAKEETE